MPAVLEDALTPIVTYTDREERQSNAFLRHQCLLTVLSAAYTSINHSAAIPVWKHPCNTYQYKLLAVSMQSLCDLARMKRL